MPANTGFPGSGATLPSSGIKPEQKLSDLHLRWILRYSSPVMTEKAPPEWNSEAERQAAKRAERSAEQLRANLQRRKAQVRARREGRADETEGLPAAGDHDGIGDGKETD